MQEIRNEINLLKEKLSELSDEDLKNIANGETLNFEIINFIEGFPTIEN